MSERDREFMQRALRLAERGWGQTAPNPMVGAVLVRGAEVVGEGWHARYGQVHAEINAIRAAPGQAQGSHLYVTLEPCMHHGQTPPCAPAVIAAGITAVTVATLDPTPAGGGVAALRAAGLTVELGCEGAAARELNAPFHFSADRPWITLKLALSAEGAIAAAPTDDGTRPRVWLTGDEARVAVHRLRAGSDAIAVGIGTVLADDPQLTVRDYPAPRVPPLRVVFDRSARTPLASALVRAARTVPTVVVTARAIAPAVAALQRAGVDVLVATDLPDALRQLRARGIRSLLVEGGARLAGAMLEADVVDRVVLLRSPRELGGGALQAFSGVRSPSGVEGSLRLLEEQRLGSDVLSRYAVPGHDV